MNPLGGAGNSGIASYGSEPGRPCNDGPPLRSVVAEPLRPLFDSSAQDKAVIAQVYAQLGRLAMASHELAEARTVLQERDARIATLERDGAAARDALANAENWARDREATIELMRTEIGRLQEAVAAAQSREEELNRIRYGVPNTPNCRGNLAQALGPWGFNYRDIPNAFVPFMNVEVDGKGAMEIKEPTSDKWSNTLP